ncbi:MAG: sugar phosphate isomerase/epimerase family protein [Deltaproteobacteria bacterium]
MDNRKLPIFINVPYKLVGANIERVAGLGVGVEVYAENNTLDELDMGDVKELGRKLRDSGIMCTAHAPFMDLSPGGYDRRIRTLSKDKIKKAVEMAHRLNAKSIVCHPGYNKWFYDGNEQLWLDSSVETWTEILAEAKGGPLVLLENIFEETPATLIALFGYFKDKGLHFCFDSGHFNLFSAVPLEAWLIPLKNRIREMHLHDNHGKSDEHLPIGWGTFPFRELKAFIAQLTGIIYTSEFHSEAHAMESIKNLQEFIS